MSTPPTIAVYGATGYTGTLVAAELARRGVPMILAGRDALKLDAAAAAARAAGGEVAGVRPASIDDPEALIGALDGAAAVINAAGPFIRTGAPVLRAAIAAGTHYVDTTGEQPWIRDTFDVFDARPRRSAGVAAVAGMGFDYLPGDLLCHLVGPHHRAAAPADRRLRRPRVRPHARDDALVARDAQGRRRRLRGRALGARPRTASRARASSSPSPRDGRPSRATRPASRSPCRGTCARAGSSRSSPPAPSPRPAWSARCRC